jgi:hypothetical protein
MTWAPAPPENRNPIKHTSNAHAEWSFMYESFLNTYGFELVQPTKKKFKELRSLESKCVPQGSAPKKDL